MKFCMVVLLRDDLSVHGLPTPFWQKGLGWSCPVRSALKRTHMQDFDSFSIMLTKSLAPNIKKLETYIALFIFLEFRINKK